MKYPFLIIGSGLSGLAAAIRISNYCPDVLLLDQHSRIGGLNSYYYRNNRLLETGLHAITNYAPKKQKHAPINKLFRQLKIKRDEFSFKEQIGSQIHFGSDQILNFNNDVNLLISEVERLFPDCHDDFCSLLKKIEVHNPFQNTTGLSARKYLEEMISDKRLIEMLLCPLCYYGSSVENDMELNQFVIMFRSIFLEGMFRPEGTIRDFLQVLKQRFVDQGGTLRLKSKVSRILVKNNTAYGVELDSGEIIEADNILSTAGYEETLALTGRDLKTRIGKRLAFIESIFLVDDSIKNNLTTSKTIIFYNSGELFNYQQSAEIVDYRSGVICFPQNFQDIGISDPLEIRLTHLANYDLWQKLSSTPEEYRRVKLQCSARSAETAEKIIGIFSDNIVYQDTFTPVTIQRYTLKHEGAIYGSPRKIADGDIGFTNLFLAGTDQGFLGIIGSMLSGVSIANQHFLTKI